MSRALLILANDGVRQRALQWVAKAPQGTRVEFKPPKRTLDQNSLMWSLLTQIAAQRTHHGMRLSAADWRLLFLDALTREMRLVPNLDGTGFVPLRSTSDLSKDEMSNLIEIIFAWCAREGVILNDEQGIAA